MNPTLYCINLDKDKARWERMKKEVQKLSSNNTKVNVIRVPAVLGKDIPSQERKLYFAPDYLKTVKDGEVGCLLSHYKIWKDFLLSDDDHRIIIEDDIKFEPGFTEKLTNTIPRIKNYDVIYLGCGGICGDGCTKLGRNLCSPSLTNLPLSKVHQAFGTYGYVISKRGANKLVDLVNNKLSAPFDAEMGTKNFDSYSFTPAIVTEGYGGASNIGSGQYSWVPGISLASPVGKMPGSYPANFYFNMMGLILVLITTYLGLAKIKINHILLFSLLFLINFLDFFLGRVGWSDMRAVLSALFNTVVPFFLYIILFSLKFK